MGPAVVFDTNILISATFSTQGNPFRCIALAREGAASSITCTEILDEYQEKLIHKFGLSPAKAEAATQEIRAISTLVGIDHDLKIVEQDHDDDAVVACAIAGGATFIVSGDRHLLALRTYAGVDIVRAAEFVGLIAQQQE